jgi:uncharacterized protein YcaQ
MERLTPLMARRIALAAQGFAERRPSAAPGRRHLRKVIDRLGLFQIDSVNVLARAHYMPLFSRLGPYEPGLLDAAASRRPRLLFEYWAHEASFLPVETQPLMRWRMERARDGHGIYKRLAAFGVEKRDFIEEVLKEVEKTGPLAASDFEGHSGSGGWWGWSEAKHALEWLFWAGYITTRTRRPSFERVYDLTERVLPAHVMEAPTPSQADAHRALLAIAARALGVATYGDLRDYFRLPVEGIAERISELVEEGELLPVAVKGWRQPAYLHREARLPRRIAARALLAPFDPLVWERSRAERLFSFRYRIEIYTPAERRVHGYYVLPFLLGDQLVARVDLKADRGAGVLRVQAAHAEEGAPANTAQELYSELRIMAGWLGLADMQIMPSGDLAPALIACAKTAV